MKLENSNPVNELPSITISISTVSKNLFKFIKTFNFSNLVHATEVIIIVQGEIFDKEICWIFYLRNKSLSRTSFNTFKNKFIGYFSQTFY